MGDRFSKILPVDEHSHPGSGLYVGTVDYVVCARILSELNINAIVCCLACEPDGLQKTLTASKINHATDYLQFPLEDSADHYISLFSGMGILYVINWIHAHRMSGKSVLVHCDAGKTRSPSVVIAYLMKFGLGTAESTAGSGMSFQEAIAFVTKKRHQIHVGLFRNELHQLNDHFFEGVELPTGDGAVHSVFWRDPNNANAISAASPAGPSAAGPTLSSPEEDTCSDTFKSPSSTSSPILTPTKDEPDVVNYALLTRQWYDMLRANSINVLTDDFVQSFLEFGGERGKALLGDIKSAVLVCKVFGVFNALIKKGRSGRDVFKQMAPAHARLGLTEADWALFNLAILSILEKRIPQGYELSRPQWETALEVLVLRMQHAINEYNQRLLQTRRISHESADMTTSSTRSQSVAVLTSSAATSVCTGGSPPAAEALLSCDSTDNPPSVVVAPGSLHETATPPIAEGILSPDWSPSRRTKMQSRSPLFRVAKLETNVNEEAEATQQTPTQERRLKPSPMEPLPPTAVANSTSITPNSFASPCTPPQQPRSAFHPNDQHKPHFYDRPPPSIITPTTPPIRPCGVGGGPIAETDEELRDGSFVRTPPPILSPNWSPSRRTPRRAQMLFGTMTKDENTKASPTTNSSTTDPALDSLSTIPMLASSSSPVPPPPAQAVSSSISCPSDPSQETDSPMAVTLSSSPSTRRKLKRTPPPTVSVDNHHTPAHHSSTNNHDEPTILSVAVSSTTPPHSGKQEQQPLHPPDALSTATSSSPQPSPTLQNFSSPGRKSRRPPPVALSEEATDRPAPAPAPAPLLQQSQPSAASAAGGSCSPSSSPVPLDQSPTADTADPARNGGGGGGGNRRGRRPPPVSTPSPTAAASATATATTSSPSHTPPPQNHNLNNKSPKNLLTDEVGDAKVLPKIDATVSPTGRRGGRGRPPPVALEPDPRNGGHSKEPTPTSSQHHPQLHTQPHQHELSVDDVFPVLNDHADDMAAGGGCSSCSSCCKPMYDGQNHSIAMPAVSQEWTPTGRRGRRPLPVNVDSNSSDNLLVSSAHSQGQQQQASVP